MTKQDEDFNMDDLDLDDDLEVEEIEVVEEAIVESTKKEKKEKKAKGSGLPSAQPLAADEIGVSTLASKLKTEPRILRGFLRTKFRDMNADKGQRYRWKKSDPILQEIVDAWKKRTIKEVKAPVAKAK